MGVRAVERVVLVRRRHHAVAIPERVHVVVLALDVREPVRVAEQRPHDLLEHVPRVRIENRIVHGLDFDGRRISQVLPRESSGHIVPLERVAHLIRITGCTQRLRHAVLRGLLEVVAREARHGLDHVAHGVRERVHDRSALLVDEPQRLLELVPDLVEIPAVSGLPDHDVRRSVVASCTAGDRRDETQAAEVHELVPRSGLGVESPRGRQRHLQLERVDLGGAHATATLCARTTRRDASTV